MLVGVHENYQGPQATLFERTAQSFPGTEVTREFEANIINPQDLVKRVVARCQQIWAQGKTAVWSFKPSPADVASGAWKPFVTALAQYVKANNLQGRLIVCIWHEPENDFKTPAEFVSLYNAVHGWLKDVDPTILTTHAALGYFYRNISVATAKKWITNADVHSIDIYSGRSFPLATTLATSKAFQTWKAALPAGAKWGVSERGFIADSTQSAVRVAAINSEADYLVSLSDTDRPYFYIIWNTPGVENDPKIVLDAAGSSAVNKMFSRLSQVVCPLCHGSGFAAQGVSYVITSTPQQ